MTKIIKRHIMIDIETMATSEDAAIVSIGAVAFDKGFMPPEPSHPTVIDQIDSLFYVNVSLNDCLRRKRVVDAGTVYWWLQEGFYARDSIQCNLLPLHVALRRLTGFINSNKGKRSKVWANGVNFDFKILRHAYENTFLNGVRSLCAWHQKDEVDMRTLRALENDIGVPKNETWTAHKRAMDNHAHNAVYDAWHQACYVYTMMNRLNWS